jgi:hypothetical protein
VIKNAGGKILEKELKMITFTHFRNSMEQYTSLRYLAETGQTITVTEKVNTVDRRFVCLPGNVRKI